jgi:RES domain
MIDMYCCGNCFGDGHLSREVIPNCSTKSGTCTFCESPDQLLVSPLALREHFELLASAYIQAPDGRLLVQWFRSDWELFQHPKMSDANAKQLLGEILDDGEIVRKHFSPIGSGISKALENWKQLRQELMHANRFFPRGEINLDRLQAMFGLLEIRAIDIPVQWFRARIQEGSIAFLSEEMGAPPKNLASHGRANPAGIPYLYLASTELTAVSEIRPHTGEFATVAEFKVETNYSEVDTKKSLMIVDLRHPRKTISPFTLSDDGAVSLLRQDTEFLEMLGEELTRPVIPKSSSYNYIPSQYLCEFIKHCGYDGVLYRSSVGDGFNLALFLPEKATCSSTKSVEITRVLVEMGLSAQQH